MTDREPLASPLRLHGSCGSLHNAGVLLLGRSGAGKSDLLLRLIDRGFALVADDIVVVQDGRAAPPDALAGLIEIRGLGLLRMTHVASVVLALVVVLDEAEPRLPLPERHEPGTGLPLLRFSPFAASTALRVEIALDCLAGRRTLLAGAFERSAGAG